MWQLLKQNFTDMKKFFFIIMMLASISGFAQSTKTSPDITDGFPYCPAGTCPSINISLDLLNFHKPRTGCLSGLGLCLKFTASVTCNSCTGKGFIKADKITVWTKLTNQTAELHFPSSIKLEKGFDKTDLSTFELDDKMLSFKFSNGLEKFVKGGIYPVTVIGDEFVVMLSLY